MKVVRGLLLILMGGFLLAGALYAAGRLSGVSAVYRHHAIATLRIEGASPESVEAFRRQLTSRPGMREAAAARSAGEAGVWLLRLQYRAESAEDAGRRLSDWTRGADTPELVRVLRASYCPLRVIRPNAGDFLLGPQERVTAP